mmetsp:Transcript_58748/g.71836  ORF Transcript_58748/g.71836 Transcript_58748/m.71836 type:complete len:109 (-) Transcript_58748:498-824(-)
MNQQGLSDEQCGMTTSRSGLWSCGWRARPCHRRQVQTMEVSKVLATTGAPEDIQPGAVQVRRVPMSRGGSAAGTGTLEPSMAAGVQRMQIPEAGALPSATEIDHTTAH